MGKIKDGSSDEGLNADPTANVLIQKKHKKHKHKKHKRKKNSHENSQENYVDISVDSDLKKTFKVRIKKEDDRVYSSDKVKEKIFKFTNPNSAGSSGLLTKSITKKKVLKTNKGKDSGTSSEEERWLDAIESGKLEEVDDELKKIKPKDPKLMTARQRAMFERKTDTEPTNSIEQLMSLPTGYKEKVMTAEAIQKAALKSLKRKQLADEKREKDKKKTMERLLKKQESKTPKLVTKGKLSKRQVPLITYKVTLDGSSISLPPAEMFPIPASKKQEIPQPICCGVATCFNPKKYSCSKTGIPLCSLTCYKINLQGVLA